MTDRSTSLRIPQPAPVTDTEVKRELVDLLNVYGKVATMTADEIKATIRAVSEGLAARNIRPAAYSEAMTRFRIGACGRSDKDRAFAPVAPVIVALAFECEREIRAAEYRQRKAQQIAPPPAEDKFPLTESEKRNAERVLAQIRKTLNPMPKELSHGR